MKLLVVGNSHAAMLMAAHRDSPESGREITFYAKPGMTPGEVALAGTELWANTPEMRERLAALGTPERVDMAAYDALVLVGSTVSTFGAVRLAQSHLVTGWPSAARDMAQGTESPGAPMPRPMLSGAAYDAALADTIHAGLSHQLLSDLRTQSELPAFVVPQPYPAEAILEPGSKYPVFRKLHKRGDGPMIARALTRAHEDAFAAMRATTLLIQPRTTVARDFLTGDAYTRGAVRLNIDHRQPSADILHAGPAMGALILDRIDEACRAAKIPTKVLINRTEIDPTE